MGVSKNFLRPKPLKRDAYAKLQDGADQGNAACGLLKPLYGLNTPCKDWYRDIRNLLLENAAERPHRLVNQYSSGRKKVSRMRRQEIPGPEQSQHRREWVRSKWQFS